MHSLHFGLWVSQRYIWRSHSICSSSPKKVKRVTGRLEAHHKLPQGELAASDRNGAVVDVKDLAALEKNLKAIETINHPVLTCDDTSLDAVATNGYKTDAATMKDSGTLDTRLWVAIQAIRSALVTLSSHKWQVTYT